MDTYHQKMWHRFYSHILDQSIEKALNCVLDFLAITLLRSGDQGGNKTISTFYKESRGHKNMHFNEDNFKVPCL